MTGDPSRLRNFEKKFIRTVRFGNDHFGAIIGYVDYVIGQSVISRVYYVEGLGHNLFSVSQFCDTDLEVAFRTHSCYVRDTDGVGLIKGSRGSNLYTISIDDMLNSSPICLLPKASKNKSWKEQPKTKNTNLEVLNNLHMDLCGPMRVQIINGKKYILVIVDDYSRFTWVKFLRSKDETPEVVIKFLKQIQVGLNKTVRNIHTDNGTEFVNKDLTDYHERVRIFYQKTVPRTPQVFGALCYPTNDSKDLGKLQPTIDIGIFIGYAPSRKGATQYRTRSYFSDAWTDKFRARTKSGSCSCLCAPTDKDLKILFQPMFDEYLEPPRVERPVSPTPAIQVPVNTTGTPSSTTIDQDAPSPSHSPSSSALQSPRLHQGVAVESTLMEDNPFAPTDNDPFINVFAPEPRSEASSSGDLSSTESPYVC
ncbi:integrase, catalytic region, zinc finger, CCHC-type containing protein [Tanacetum coccineum]